MKNIAIIESCDTKYKEAAFIRDYFKNIGIKGIVLDTSTGNNKSYNYDISREEIIKLSGTTWEDMKSKTKGEKIECMKNAIANYVYTLYRNGEIDGVISIGGLQNTIMATNAMQKLPIGFPKVMATTVASGTRKFELVVGQKDIVVIPSICDCTGLNKITTKIIENACACCAGMVEKSSGEIEKGDKPTVAVTLMGVTNIGASAAIDELERNGIEVLGFHATGVGGAVMEQMAEDGLIDGILDLTLHEITSEYFGGGFSYGVDAKVRLLKSTEKKIPLVVSLGGVDFVDFSVNELPNNINERKYMMHNATTAHVKILPKEAEDIGNIISERLSNVEYPIKLLLPTDGMRHNTQIDEELYSPETDKVLINTLKEKMNKNVEMVTIDGNLDTYDWGVKAAKYLINELNNANLLKV